MSGKLSYFPALLCALYDSPIDALVAQCVPRDEALELVAAAWVGEPQTCILATIDGGRSVAALRTEQGRWAACNAFPDQCCATPHDAERALKKLLKRGRQGYVGTLTVDEKKPAQN